MSDFNPLLAREYADLLRRKFGGDLLIGSLSPEIIPMYDVGRLAEEDFALVGTKTWQLRLAAVAGGAGVISGVAISNPAGSGGLTVITKIVPSTGTIYSYFHRFAVIQANYVFGSNVLSRDSRFSTAAGGTILGFTQGLLKIAGAGTVGTIVMSGTQPAADHHALDVEPVTLAPGFNIIVEHQTANTGITVDFFGYELSARPEELNVP